MRNVGIRRDSPTQKERRQLLQHHKNRCYWCGVEFGSWAVSKNGKKSFVITPHWDHIIPLHFYKLWGWRMPDRLLRYAPTCRICNSNKSTYVFKSVQDGKIWCRQRIKEQGWSFVSAR